MTRPPIRLSLAVVAVGALVGCVRRTLSVPSDGGVWPDAPSDGIVWPDAPVDGGPEGPRVLVLPKLPAFPLPCTDDRDCAGNMRCDQQRDDNDGVHARNGYCYIEGCSSSATLPSRACPEESRCDPFYAGGRCYKTCDSASREDCRGHPADLYGDYECLTGIVDCEEDWGGDSRGYPAITCYGLCEPADHVPCSRFVGDDSCSDLGVMGSMCCRDRVSGAALPEGSAEGFCLDAQTPSGCLEGYTDCDGLCLDLLSNRDNCGACGDGCSPGQDCIDGECG